MGHHFCSHTSESGSVRLLTSTALDAAMKVPQLIRAVRVHDVRDSWFTYRESSFGKSALPNSAFGTLARWVRPNNYSGSAQIESIILTTTEEKNFSAAGYSQVKPQQIASAKAIFRRVNILTPFYATTSINPACSPWQNGQLRGPVIPSSNTPLRAQCSRFIFLGYNRAGFQKEKPPFEFDVAFRSKCGLRLENAGLWHEDEAGYTESAESM
ncbi:hypothetical protein C8R45DRAFT_917966 [Mycena sanguinolenta]|nr:hypothetical protein C8R45DRAFT_917966 [Mycena sanguinolenta]